MHLSDMSEKDLLVASVENIFNLVALPSLSFHELLQLIAIFDFREGSRLLVTQVLAYWTLVTELMIFAKAIHHL